MKMTLDAAIALLQKAEYLAHLEVREIDNTTTTFALWPERDCFLLVASSNEHELRFWQFDKTTNAEVDINDSYMTLVASPDALNENGGLLKFKLLRREPLALYREVPCA